MKDIKKEITQIKGLSIEEVQSLADLKDSKFYPILRGFLKKMAYDTMWKTTKIPADDPNLAIKKSKYDGIMWAAREIDNRIREARKELEKVIEKEK